MIVLGVSSCLVGVECRYNGEHAKDEFVSNRLSKFFTFMEFCPETELLGTPRETIKLVQKDQVVAVTNKTNKEITEELKNLSFSYGEKVKKEALRGFIFKAKSPSCGIERVKVYMPNGMPTTSSIGIFAREVFKGNPYLPIEDEKRLIDPWLRENFITHVYAYDSYLNFKEMEKDYKDLVAFHSRFKFFLQSKNENNYRELGRVVANPDKRGFDEVLKSYEPLFLETIACKSDRGKIVNVCQHIQGFIKNNLSKEEKKSLTDTLDEFQKGIVPLIAYLKPLEIFMKKYKQDYILNQFFLNPYPSELGLRSDVRAYK